MRRCIRWTVKRKPSDAVIRIPISAQRIGFQRSAPWCVPIKCVTPRLISGPSSSKNFRQKNPKTNRLIIDRPILKPMPPTTSYANRFQARDDVVSYDLKEYGADSYSSRIWELQRPLLAEILLQHQAAVRHSLTLLDFACGTGRVLASLEPNVVAADGIDISPEMVAVARTKCTKARLQVGDILTQPELLQNNYDVITAFRFLLNVEPEIRRRALRRLREVIRAPHGLLVVNVHGNARSLRHPAIVWRRWRERSHKTDAMLNEM